MPIDYLSLLQHRLIDTTLQIIDHGSVLYLILLQIILYNQQHIFSSLENIYENWLNVKYSRIMSYASNDSPPFTDIKKTGLSVIYAISFTVGDTNNMTSAVTLKTTSYDLDTDKNTAAAIAQTCLSSSYQSSNNNPSSLNT